MHAMSGVILCQRILSTMILCEPVGPDIDLIDIDCRQRGRRFLHKPTRGGRQVRVLLPADQSLDHGSVLAIDGGVSIVTHILPCAALVMRIANVRQGAEMAYAIGNLHLLMEITDTELIIPADDENEAALGRLGYKFDVQVRRIRPDSSFVPQVEVAAANDLVRKI